MADSFRRVDENEVAFTDEILGFALCPNQPRELAGTLEAKAKFYRNYISNLPQGTTRKQHFQAVLYYKEVCANWKFHGEPFHPFTLETAANNFDRWLMKKWDARFRRETCDARDHRSYVLNVVVCLSVAIKMHAYSSVEFTAEFLRAARKCFEMIDKDSSGTLTKTEIVKAVAEDKEVVAFLKNCGWENLQFLLVPARLEKALEVLDTSKDGEVDADEWEEAIRRGVSKRLDSRHLTKARPLNEFLLMRCRELGVEDASVEELHKTEVDFLVELDWKVAPPTATAWVFVLTLYVGPGIIDARDWDTSKVTTVEESARAHIRAFSPFAAREPPQQVAVAALCCALEVNDVEATTDELLAAVSTLQMDDGTRLGFPRDELSAIVERMQRAWDDPENDWDAQRLADEAAVDAQRDADEAAAAADEAAAAARRRAEEATAEARRLADDAAAEELLGIFDDRVDDDDDVREKGERSISARGVDQFHEDVDYEDLLSPLSIDADVPPSLVEFTTKTAPSLEAPPAKRPCPQRPSEPLRFD